MFDEKRDLKHSGSEEQDHGALHAGQPFETVNEENVGLSSAEKRKLKFKIDSRLLIVIWLMYFVNLLDRVSVGGSVAYGFRTDLGVTGDKYNLGIALFYVFYSISEVPSNLILKKVGAKIWLPILGIAFGVCTICTALIHNASEFLAMRVLLGITESGTLPGIVYFLSTWYDRHELALRMPLFISASPLASGVGSLLATAEYEIGTINSTIYGWRNSRRSALFPSAWLIPSAVFFLNGLIALPVSLACFVLLPWSPSKAHMLTERERDFIMARSVRLTAGLAREEATKWPLIIRGFTSIHVWLGIVPWFVAQILASSLTFFLAAILRQDFGYSARQSNLHVAYTFFFSFGMTPILGYCADRSKIHAPWILFSTCLALMGSCMFSYSTNQNARYAGAFFANLGIFGGTGINTAWVTSNLSPYTTRATGTAFMISTGALGGIVGAYVFLASEAPKYPTGAAITAAFLAAAICSVCFHWWYCVWENKQRAAGKRDHRLVGKTQDEIDMLGNRHPHFKLTY